MHTGLKTVNQFYQTSPKRVIDYFKTEDKIIGELNPFFFSFMVNFILDQAPALLLSPANPTVSTLLPNLFNIALYTILAFEEDLFSGIQGRLYSILIRFVNFVGANLEEATKLGIMQHLLNNTLFKNMVSAVNYDVDSGKFNNQQKMLLEIHLKLTDLHEKIMEQKIAKIDSNLKNSEGILAVRRGKTILQDK